MVMNDEILQHLATEDDPELWRVALETILGDVEKQQDMMVEIGSCSHWLRPHGSTWMADGGFAAPVGYGSGSGGFSYRALPQFDWSVMLKWSGEEWQLAKRKSARHALRITIPSRTRRHRQAAVHTLWMTEREKQVRFYGFRKRDGEWKCTAVKW
jgi:hypothetical protein